MNRRLLKRVVAPPRALFHIGLGPVFRHRVLMLVHHGRRSGRRYETLLEVIQWNEDAHEACVLSAFGDDAQWLQNARAGAEIEVQIARERFTASMRVLETPEAERVLAGYEERNRLLVPVIHRALGLFAGIRYDGTPSTRHQIAERLPIVAFRPARP
jgi:deazaflavin-dependent oxidoreductase (nitroreductase family)